MSKIDPSLYYSQNIGLVHQVARKGYGRLQNIGAAMPYEDLVQELSIVFLKAYELHDPEKSKFSTYFTFSAYNRLNRIAENYQIERIELGFRSVEELNEDSEDGDTFDSLPDSRQTPQEIYEARANSADIRANLSPMATLVTEWLIDPPEFVLDEIRKAHAHTEYAKSEGFTRRHMAKLSIPFVCDMLMAVSSVSASEVRAVKQELKEVIDKEERYDFSR